MPDTPLHEHRGIQRYDIDVPDAEFIRSDNGPVVDVDDHLAAVASAVAAEREACAKIVESYMHAVGPAKPDIIDRIASYNNKTCQLIAAAIRNRGTT